MTADEFTDETLMAFADGELDPDQAARVEAAIAADSDLARRAALFADTGDVLARAAAARPEAPVPDALMARVHETLAAARAEDSGDNVVPLRRPALPIRPMAIAASLALGIGLAGGLAIGLSSGGGGGAPDG
ncbi:MAG: zf-HC2 domain-containing protein, partial [Rhodovulum sp.]